ncbi:MAG: heavy metal-binding domain-containing protein [Ardenticatenales bacterium]|nr:heavy metal-binding domain-containing protein [Ardenticatenales bacterium]
MILSTTSVIQGLDVFEYLGVVTGEAILGANIFRDMFTGLRDIVGGRANSYEKELRRARDIAMDEMKEQARHLGANAVIGIDIDYQTITLQDGGSMLMVTVSGTALRVG